MGTDIHGPFVEVNLRPGQPWQCVGDLDWQRDYEAFALMAGVRAEGQDSQPLFEPRGNPADMSVRYEFHADEGGCHSASWLTDTELQRVQEAYPNGPSFQINLALKFMAAVAEEGHDLLQRSRDYWEKHTPSGKTVRQTPGGFRTTLGRSRRLWCGCPTSAWCFALTTNA